MYSDEFGSLVLEAVRRRLEPGYTAQVMEVRKNNGLILHGMSILSGEGNIGPCIYLEEYYRRYLEGYMTLNEIAEEVVKTCKGLLETSSWDSSVFADYGKAKENIRCRLVNTERNRELLETVPHREFLDMSVIYVAEFPWDGGSKIASIQVKNEHAGKLWGIGEEELFRQARENMERQDEYILSDFRNVMEAVLQKDDCVGDEEYQVPMLILSNRHTLNGAAGMLSDRMLKEAAGIFGSDFIILPSSVHEVLLMPAADDAGWTEDVVKIVQEVNDTQLAPDEILSYHVYRYSVQAGEVFIAA